MLAADVGGNPPPPIVGLAYRPAPKALAYLLLPVSLAGAAAPEAREAMACVWASTVERSGGFGDASLAAACTGVSGFFSTGAPATGAGVMGAIEALPASKTLLSSATAAVKASSVTLSVPFSATTVNFSIRAFVPMPALVNTSVPEAMARSDVILLSSEA